MVSLKHLSVVATIVLGLVQSTSALPLPQTGVSCAGDGHRAGAAGCVSKTKPESLEAYVLRKLHNRRSHLPRNQDYQIASLRRRVSNKQPASPPKKAPGTPPKPQPAAPPKKAAATPATAKKPAAGPPNKGPATPPKKPGSVCKRDECAGKEIFVALYSQGTGNKINPRTGHGTYHWGYLIGPRHGIASIYHATDRNNIDPKTFRMENPTGGWWFEGRTNVKSWESKKLLGRISIGTVPQGVTDDELTALFKAVPLPALGGVVQESCRTWLFKAMTSLQQKGWVPKTIDHKALEEWGFSYADARAKGQRQDIETYSP